MKTNKMMRDLVLEVVDNQLNSGDPPETGATYKRLLNAGIQEQEVKRLIACVGGQRTVCHSEIAAAVRS